MMPFKFTSTRGKDSSFSAPEAIFQGLAPDGGLFVPTAFPQLGLRLEELSTKSYVELTTHLLKQGLPGYAPETIDAIVRTGYAAEKFDDPLFAPVKSFEDRHFIELFHGPTLAFKDMALSLLPHLLVAARNQLGISKEVVILTATSGDTGSAALTGFADLPGTRILVFYPDQGISLVQKKQMVCQPGKNLFVCGVNGNFDHAQNLVKSLFSDETIRLELKKNNQSFSTANSMNVGRLIPQMVYYFHAYGQLISTKKIRCGEPVNIVVPSGNFGNILAAWYAKKAGLPVGKFIIASNRNHALPDFFNTGTYTADRTFHRTTSPSMDILISSNLERLLYHLSDNDSALIAQLMQSLKQQKHYSVPDSLQTRLQSEFFAAYADDESCRDEIKSYYQKNNYLLDPHTAVASRVLTQYQKETCDYTPALITATASPFKFPATVLPALFDDISSGSDFDRIRQLADKTNTSVRSTLLDLETAEPLHTDHCSPKTALDYVRTTLSN